MRHLCVATQILLFVASSAVGQIKFDAGLIMPPHPEEASTFGNRVSVDGDWMAIGADYDGSELGLGWVHMYRRLDETWTLHQSIQGPNSFSGDHFGMPVVLRGDRMLVGSPWDGETGFRSGAVHVYDLVDGTWAWRQKLTANVADNSGALFGLACDFGRDRDEIVVGAFLESVHESASGGVWTFRENQGVFELAQHLTLPGHQPSAYFGASIAADATVLAIGVTGLVGESGVRHGGVAIHHLIDGRWTMRGMLVPVHPKWHQVFGSWVDIESDRMAVGSPSEEGPTGTFGAVHLYELVVDLPWLDEVLYADEVGSDGFGFPCILDSEGDRLFVGGYRSNLEGEANSGGAWIVDRREEGWSARVRLVSDAVRGGDFFGLTAAFDGDAVVVGAPRHDGVTEDAGAVVQFSLEDCDDSGLLDVWEIANSDHVDLDADGVPDSCQTPREDVNRDGTIDGIDIARVFAAWGSTLIVPEDINEDGLVNAGDVARVLTRWST